MTGSIDIGRFEVSAASADIAAFRAAIGLDPADNTVPLTFPMRWLVMPDVRAMLAALVPESDLVLVHESQSFDYAASLDVDTTYLLTLSASREVSPPRLVLKGKIAGVDGIEVGTLETMLRLFSTEAVAA